jgi:hypothetical protein
MTKKNKKIMGRPPVGTENEKSALLSTRFTQSEMERIDHAAKLAKQTKSEWTRFILLSAAEDGKVTP